MQISQFEEKVQKVFHKKILFYFTWCIMLYMFQDNKKMGVFLFLLVIIILSGLSYYYYSTVINKKQEPAVLPNISLEERTAILNELNATPSTIKVSAEERAQILNELKAQEVNQPKNLTAQDKKAILDSFN